MTYQDFLLIAHLINLKPGVLLPDLYEQLQVIINFREHGNQEVPVLKDLCSNCPSPSKEEKNNISHSIKTDINEPILHPYFSEE